MKQVITHLKNKVTLATRKFTEAWLSCATMMVQGDFTVFTVNHALVAAKTGSLAAVGLVITSYVTRLDNWIAMAWITGLVVSVADIVIHPTHFGEAWTEAVLTGIGAAILSVLLGKIYDK